jgi:predicted kinase
MLLTVKVNRKTVHLLCGPSGAGKTTHAHKIARETQAIHLAIDDCLKPLSIPDSFDMAYIQMVMEKAEQCAGQLLEKARQHLAQGKEVVLDIATFRRIERDFVRNWAKSLNSHVILYYVSANQATRRNRVLKRNSAKGKAHSFDVPEWWFNCAERLFEPPSQDEAPILINNDPG